MPNPPSSVCTVLSRLFCGLLLLLTLLASSSYAEQLPIKNYSTADGLVQDRVKRIARDSRGFLWFCTAAGLSRFDGSGFTNYDEQHGLSYPSLNDLVETRSGNYWIASNGGGVYLFNPQPRKNTQSSTQKAGDQQELFTQYSVGNNQRTNRVNRLFEDHSGNLWAGTDEGLFILVQDSQGYRFQNVSFDVPELADLTVQIWCFLEDKEGTLWIGTTAGLVCRSPDGKFRRYHLLPNAAGNILDLFLDHEDRLWVSHFAGLLIAKPHGNLANQAEPWRLLTRSPDDIRQQRIRLPESRGEAYAYSNSDGLAHQTITGTFQTTDGRFWLSSHGGIMSVERDRLRTYTLAQGLRTNVYTAMMEDRDGNLWFGSMTSGAQKLVRNGLHSYREADGLYYGYVLKIFEDRDGNLCVLDRSPSLIRCLADQVFHPLGLNLVQTERVDDVLQDHVGEWWLATTNGLYRFPNVTLKELGRVKRQTFNTADGLGSNSVRRLFEDSRGDLWISTPGSNPITRWERTTGKFFKYGAAKGLPTGGVWSFAEDRAGGIWCGFRDSGIALSLLRFHHRIKMSGSAQTCAERFI